MPDDHSTARVDDDAADDLTRQFAVARDRLSAARAKLDELGIGAGRPIDSVPSETPGSFDPAAEAAVGEFQAANAEFVRLEDQLRPRWAEQAADNAEQAAENSEQAAADAEQAAENARADR